MRKKLTIPDWVHECLEDSTTDRKFWITKGLGAGGTFGLALWHTILCLENINSRYSWSVAPTYQQVIDTLMPAFTKCLVEEFKFEEGFDFNVVTSGRPRIELVKTNQEITFRSANKPERMVGANISHLSGTEPGLWPVEAFEKSDNRVRCPSAKRLQSLFEGTPEGLGNTYEQQANFPPGVDEARNARRIVLHTSDNPFLPAGYVKKVEKTYSYDPAKLEAYLYGRFTSFTRGSAYWEFRDSRNVVDVPALDPALPLLLSFDFNLSPLAWVLVQRQPVTRGFNRYFKYVVIGESGGHSRGVLDACAEFIAKYPPHIWRNVPIEVYGDASGYAGSHLAPNCGYDQIETSLRPRYKSVSVMAERSNPDIKDRLERHNQLLAFQRVAISNRCRHTINSHAQTNLKKGMWKIEKPSGEDWTHYADALGYLLFQHSRGEDLEHPDREKVYGISA